MYNIYWTDGEFNAKRRGNTLEDALVVAANVLLNGGVVTKMILSEDDHE